MNPWDIIGWIVLTFIGTLTFLAVAGISIRVYHKVWLPYWKHLRTRNVEPAVGQVWIQDGSILRITDIYDSGRFGIKCGNGSWGETPEEFKQRIRNRKLYLHQFND